MVLAGVFFVVNGGVSRVVLRAGVAPVTLTSIRVTGSFLLFLSWALLGRRTALRLPRGRDLVPLVGLGLVGVAALQWAYFVAVDRLPIGIALMLEYTAPVLVALWARFIGHEAVRNRMWVAIGLSLVGLALISQVWQGLVFDTVGVLAGFGAALCFAGYFLLGEHGVARQDPLAVVLWSFGVATVALNLVSPVSGVSTAVLGHSTSLLGSLSGWQAPVWLLLGWVVSLGSVLPFFLELYALQHLPATVVVVVAMIEPVGSVVLGWSWFGESLTAVQVVGCAAVVSGIALAQTARRTAPAPVTV